MNGVAERTDLIRHPDTSLREWWRFAAGVTDREVWLPHR